MNVRDASEYLKRKHGIVVQPGTVTKWISRGYLVGEKMGGIWDVSDETLDDAIESRDIPRKNGRKATLSKETRSQIRDMFDKGGWSQKELAKHFGVSESYISLIVRGLR